MKMRLLLITLLLALSLQGLQGQERTEIGDHFDRDGDGWCDLWVNLFDFKSRSRRRDADGDGVTDYKEMLRFTDPYTKNLDPAAVTPITMQSHGAGEGPEDLHYSFQTIPGKVYVKQVSADLVSWEEEEIFWAEEDVYTITVTPTQEREFFRLRQGAMRAGFDEYSLTADPEDHNLASDAVELGFDMLFHEDSVNEVFLDTNGGITLLYPSDSDAVFPIDFGGYSGIAGREDSPPRIAPYWGDVDHRPFGIGPIVANQIVYGHGEVDGRVAFGASWKSVGYYDLHTDRVNSFQLILIDRSDIDVGAFDMEFNYNQIQWEAGDNDNGLGGIWSGIGGKHLIAVAGMSSGLFESWPGENALQYFRSGETVLDSPQLDFDPVSGEPNTETGLIYNSRLTSFPGRYRFEFRDGKAHQFVVVNRPERFEWVSLIQGVGTLVMEGTALNPSGGEENAYWYLDQIAPGGGPPESVTIIADADTPISTFQFTQPGTYTLRIQGFDAGGKTFVESYKQWAQAAEVEVIVNVSGP